MKVAHACSIMQVATSPVLAPMTMYTCGLRVQGVFDCSGVPCSSFCETTSAHQSLILATAWCSHICGHLWCQAHHVASYSSHVPMLRKALSSSVSMSHEDVLWQGTLLKAAVLQAVVGTVVPSPPAMAMAHPPPPPATVLHLPRVEMVNSPAKTVHMRIYCFPQLLFTQSCHCANVQIHVSACNNS